MVTFILQQHLVKGRLMQNDRETLWTYYIVSWYFAAYYETNDNGVILMLEKLPYLIEH
jgi:uncharacterized membrane protein YhdT